PLPPAEGRARLRPEPVGAHVEDDEPPDEISVSRPRSAGDRLGEPALHQHPRRLGVALVATKLEVLEAARSEELAVFFQLEPHAERHARQPAPAGLALGFADQRSRDALPSAGRSDGDAADVDRVVLPFPKAGADADGS